MTLKTASGMDLTPLQVQVAGDPTLDLYRKVGESVVHNALKNITEGPLLGGGGVASQVKELAETAKTLSSMYKDQEDSAYQRLKEEREARERAEKQLEQLKSSQREGELGILKIVMDLMDKMDNRFTSLVEKMDERLEKLLARQGQGGDDEFKKTLAQIGMQVLQGSLNRDPQDELKRVVELANLIRQVSQSVGSSLPPELQVELYRIQKDAELKAKEAELKERLAEKEDRRAEQRANTLQQAAGALIQFAASRLGGQQAEPQQVAAPLRRYPCSSCGEEIIAKAGREPKSCPFCGAPMLKQAAAGGGA